MAEELKRHKEQEEQDNDRRIENEIEAIFGDPKRNAFASSLADALGLHRNTVSGRTWHLTRPLHLGDRVFTAGELVMVKDLLDVIKKDREARKRRSKPQLKQAEALTEDVADLQEKLENMLEQNAQLFLEVEDLRDQLRLLKRSNELTVNNFAEKVQEAKELREERHHLRIHVRELEARISELQASKGKKASLIVLSTAGSQHEDGDVTEGGSE